jgi:photosystem II stability/assembly factor-like uncharacterized protein
MQAYDQVPFLYTTVDGGHTLVDHNIYAQSGFMLRTARTVFFTSEDVGYVAGTQIMKTQDGGIDWDISLDFGYIAGRLAELHFATPDSGYVVGESWNGPIPIFWKTANAGGTWIESDPPGDESTQLTCLARPTAHALYAGSIDTGGRTLFKSTNDGDTWAVLNTTLSFNSLNFSSATTGCAGTDTGIYRTTDGGVSWSLVQSTPVAVNCVRIRYDRGFAVMANGGIYQTDDNGVSWSAMTSPVQGSAALYYISLISPNDAYAVGSAGTILRYSNPQGIGDAPGNTVTLLMQNVPNPVSARTTIGYRLSADQSVSLKLYDVQGRELRTLRSGPQQAGAHGVELDAAGLVDGVYYYRLKTDGVVENRKLVIQR